MPQFETTYFISQIFWLLLSFGALYLGVYFIIFPLFNSIFQARQQRIEGVLEKAEKLAQETQKLEETIENKKQVFEKRSIEQLNTIQRQQMQEFQKNIDETEKRLLKMLQKKIQSVECEEKTVLKHSNDFVLKAMKGKL